MLSAGKIKAALGLCRVYSAEAEEECPDGCPYQREDIECVRRLHEDAAALIALLEERARNGPAGGNAAALHPGDGQGDGADGRDRGA